MNNLLNLAMSVVGSTRIRLMLPTDRKPNAYGEFITEFAPPISVVANVQPVEMTTYQSLGFDTSKRYVSVHLNKQIDLANAGINPPRFVWQRGTFEFVKNTDWTYLNGWTQAIAVEVSHD